MEKQDDCLIIWGVAQVSELPLKIIVILVQ